MQQLRGKAGASTQLLLTSKPNTVLCVTEGPFPSDETEAPREEATNQCDLLGSGKGWDGACPLLALQPRASLAAGNAVSRPKEVAVL